MKYRLLSLLFAFAIIPVLGAQNVSFTMDAPAVVALNEPFKVVYTCDKSVDKFNAPDIPDFDILAGPTQFTSQSTSTINGKRTSSFQVSFTYILQPRSEGIFTLPKASVSVGGKTYYSNESKIEVVKESDSSSSGANSGNDASSGKSSYSSGPSEDDIFLKMSINKTSAVKGEPVIATIELFTKVPIMAFEDIRFPTFNGFWSQEIESPQNVNFERRNYKGTIYNVALLRKYMLLPQQDGTIEIDPASMVAQIQIRMSGGGNSIFDDFFGNYQTIRKRLVSDRLAVRVKPLPANAPQSFSGGVGRFDMSVDMGRDSLSLHEASSVRVTISGTGNVNLVEPPKLSFPADFEVYDVKTEDRTSSNSGGTQGSKIFEYPFIPRVPGVYEIPPVEFSYYDTSSGVYRTIKSDPLTVKVGGGASVPASSLTVSAAGKQTVKVLGEDIRYINVKNLSLSRGVSFFVASPLYWIIVVLIVMAGYVSYRIMAGIVRKRGDVAGRKSRKANKIAKLRLQTANALLKQKLYSAFYEELHRAIMGYVADKFSMSFSDMSKENISEYVSSRGVDSEVAERLVSLIDACEFARYAPEASYEEMDKHYREAIEIITSLEDKFKS